MALNYNILFHYNELHCEFSGHIVETIRQFNNLFFSLLDFFICWLNSKLRPKSQ